MKKNRWVKFAFYFFSILALRLLVMSNVSMASHLLNSLLMALSFVFIFDSFVVGKKLEKKDH